MIASICGIVIGHKAAHLLDDQTLSGTLVASVRWSTCSGAAAAQPGQPAGASAAAGSSPPMPEPSCTTVLRPLPWPDRGRGRPGGASSRACRRDCSSVTPKLDVIDLPFRAIMGSSASSARSSSARRWPCCCRSRHRA